MESDENSGKEYLRWGKNTRIQHIVLLGTFVAQIVTGFPLSFPETWWAKLLVELMGGWWWRTQIHHWSGLLMVLLGVYHVFNLLINHKNIKSLMKHKMMISKRDVRELIQYFKALFGFGEMPSWDRYIWKEKLEYWGVVWGILVMGISGFILWFPFVALKFIPFGWVNLAGVMHFYEAFVATLVVIISHFYNVHFLPDDPMQMTWLTGKMTREQMKHHHPDELKDIDMFGEEPRR